VTGPSLNEGESFSDYKPDVEEMSLMNLDDVAARQKGR